MQTNMQKLIKLWKTESAKGRKVQNKTKPLPGVGRGLGERVGRGNCGQPRVKFDLLIYKSAKLFERGRCHGRRVATAAAVCIVVEGDRERRRGILYGSYKLLLFMRQVLVFQSHNCDTFHNSQLFFHNSNNKINWNVGKHVKINYMAHVLGVLSVCVSGVWAVCLPLGMNGDSLGGYASGNRRNRILICTLAAFVSQHWRWGRRWGWVEVWVRQISHPPGGNSKKPPRDLSGLQNRKRYNPPPNTASPVPVPLLAPSLCHSKRITQLLRLFAGNN